MKKVIWTLNIDNYEPEITALTYPLLKRYAKKIDAQFKVITKRKFPKFPVVYEKLQIHELGRSFDWNIFFDSDALVHPDMFDITDHLRKDTICHNANDMAGNRWKYDQFFRRDGRHIGSCNWFTVGSNWCLDLWKPLDDLTLEQALVNIYPTVSEVNSGIFSKDHLLDDYTLSRNIAKYGLKFDTLGNIQQRLGDKGQYLWHQYAITAEAKVARMLEVLKTWNV